MSGLKHCNYQTLSSTNFKRKKENVSRLTHNLQKEALEFYFHSTGRVKILLLEGKYFLNVVTKIILHKTLMNIFLGLLVQE